MQIRLYLKMLQNGWWIIVLSTLSALVIALVSSYTTTPTYRATARFLISPNNDLMSGRDIVNSLSALDKRSIASTYAEILDSDRIYKDTAAALQIDPADLRSYQLSAVVLPDSNILTLSAIGPNPNVAAALVNSVGQQGIDYIRNIYQVYTIAVLDTAKPPTGVLSPQPQRDASIAVVLGLILGGALAIARELLRTPMQQLRRQIKTDFGSGAFNRGYIDDRVAELARTQPQSFSLGLLWFESLDGLLKQLPAETGRQLLRQITARAREELRGRDIVGRWNEQSFAILMPAASAKEAQRALEQVQAALGQPIALPLHPETIQLVTHELLVQPQADEDAAALLQRADQELAKLREQGFSMASSVSKAPGSLI